MTGRDTNDSASRRGFRRGLIVGLVVGLVCTAAAGSWAAMGKMHWDKRNWHFQVGYMAGFIDVVRIVQARHPDISFAREFKIPPKIPPHLWRERVNRLYGEEEHANRPLTQVIVIAGQQFAAETGYTHQPSGSVGFGALHAVIEQRAKAQREQRAAESEASESGEGPEESPGAAGSDEAAQP